MAGLPGIFPKEWSDPDMHCANSCRLIISWTIHVAAPLPEQAIEQTPTMDNPDSRVHLIKDIQESASCLPNISHRFIIEPEQQNRTGIKAEVADYQNELQPVLLVRMRILHVILCRIRFLSTNRPLSSELVDL